MADHGNTPGALPEVAFDFDVTGVDGPWTVRGFVVRERLSAPYEGAVDVAVAPFADPDALLGLPCALTLTRGALARRFTGVVTAVEDRGVDRESRVFEVSFAPALALLEHGAHYRVWQRATALQVAREVLAAASLYTGDRLSLPADETPPREYCVQYGERDLDFVRRMLAEEGLLFAVGDDDALEVFDARGATGRPRVPHAGDADEAIPVLGGGAATASEEGIARVDRARAVTPRALATREHDFTRPQVPLGAGEAGARGVIERYPARAPLGPYDEASHRYGGTDVARAARVALQGETSGAELVRGEGTVTGMRAGLTFALAEEGARGLAGRYLLTAVMHVGHAPDAGLSDGDGASARERYRNVFEGVPVARAWAAPTTPRARADQAQVAHVVAEPGSDEEVCTDHYGRVLVRFPWDRPDARTPSQAGARDSCWLRVMQPWAGPAWGFHFTPRVGMEVVVHFLDGDPDRPFVAGCLPNAVNVPPVELPRRKTQSAIRTQTSPGGGGYNELRFEDRAGDEEVYLRAQRDQRVEVLHDRALSVGRDAQAQIGRDESHYVGRDRNVDVTGNETHAVEGDRALTVTGHEVRDVGGNHSLLVHRSITLHADEHGRVTTQDGLVVEVGGSGGTRTEMTPDDVTTRAPRRHGVAVGDDVRAEMSTERITLEAPRGLALVCGDTRVELEGDRIVLQTRSGARVELDGDKITVKTSGAVSIKGSQVTHN